MRGFWSRCREGRIRSRFFMRCSRCASALAIESPRRISIMESAARNPIAMRNSCANCARDARVDLIVERARDLSADTPNLEERAREARHAFLNAAADRIGAEYIALAHQADDQAETVMMRLLRGAGAAGLAAMAERGPGRIIRPMLACNPRRGDDVSREHRREVCERQLQSVLRLPAQSSPHRADADAGEQLRARAARAGWSSSPRRCARSTISSVRRRSANWNRSASIRGLDISALRATSSGAPSGGDPAIHQA